VTVRLIATDLDGTLLHSDGSVSERSRAVLTSATAAGFLVVFTTGRPPRWMPPVAEATGHTGVAVCANGALLYDMETEEVVRENPLDPAVGAEVARALRERIPDLVFAVERGTGFGLEPQYRARAPLPSGAEVAAIEDLLTAPVAKLLARHPTLDSDTLLAQAREIVGDLATFTHSSPNGLLEISGPGVSKALALEQLATEGGIASDETIGFGDMPNDLPMLAWVGHSVAVANAHDDVLAAVDEVTASNDDDGVAVVIERLLSDRSA